MILSKSMMYDAVTKSLLPVYRERNDYCRYRALELAAEEIYKKPVEGSVAEAGVALGEFAQILNRLFHDRKLYLYDTFEGFNEGDKNKELEMGYTSTTWFEEAKDFKCLGDANKNIEAVRKKMTRKENCVFRKGYFPDSAAGEDKEKFAFVSVDMDLYEPIYNALKFFYPRLTPGGYIFLHDYNHYEFKGVKVAVEKFERENGCLHKVPLPDAGGTLIISK